MKRLLRQNFDHWIQLKQLKKTKKTDQFDKNASQLPRRGRKYKHVKKNSTKKIQKTFHKIRKLSEQKPQPSDHSSFNERCDFNQKFSKKVDFEISKETSPISPPLKNSPTTRSFDGCLIRRLP
jgi:hypothetical protein